MWNKKLRELGVLLFEEDPDDEPSGGGGGEPEGGEDPEGGGEPQPRTISEDALPESLRGKSPEEIKGTLDTMARVLQTRNDDNDELRGKLSELEARLNNQPAPKQEPEEPGKPLEELIYDDPKAAVSQAIQELGFVDQFNNLAGMASEGVFAAAKTSLPDFADHEEEVRKTLQDNNVAATSESVKRAYLMAVGDKALKDKQEAARKAAANVEAPSPPSKQRDDKKKKKSKLTDLDKELARGMGLSDDEFVEWQEKEYLEMDVPMGTE